MLVIGIRDDVARLDSWRGSRRYSPFSRQSWSALLAIAVTFAFLVVPTGSVAQSREVLLGTITAGGSTSIRDRERAAAELLADGIAALERGEVMIGRRHLEVLVERFPEARAASVARDELGALYSGQRSRGYLAVRDGDDERITPQSTDSTKSAPLEPRARSAQSEAAREQALAHKRQLEEDRRLLGLAYEFQSSAGDRVFFAESSSELGAKARSVLAAQARWLARHRELPVTIEAHADDHRGQRELDVRLAEKRGAAVRERLLEEGISPERITVQAFGRDRPVATCGSPECAVQNRRVVTRIGAAGAPDSTTVRGRETPALATAPKGGDGRTRSD